MTIFTPWGVTSTNENAVTYLSGGAGAGAFYADPAYDFDYGGHVIVTDFEIGIDRLAITGMAIALDDGAPNYTSNQGFILFEQIGADMVFTYGANATWGNGRTSTLVVESTNLQEFSASLTGSGRRLALFTTLVRFDPVYVGHFKCNLKCIIDYPNLSNYLRDLYQMCGVADMVRMDHIKSHSFGSHETVNPSRIMPLGPKLDYL